MKGVDFSMDFDKKEFARILLNIKNIYGSINKMAEKTDVTSAYLSKLSRLMYDNPPSPEILKKIANFSGGITSYNELMYVCGYIDKDFYINLRSKIARKFIKGKYKPQLEHYSLNDDDMNLLINIYAVDNPDLINPILKKVPILSINKFSRLLHDISCEIDNELANYSNISDASSQYYMCPVYGQISAGQPNWAEECIEGRIPIDPNLMNIVNPEEHFFLRVNGESMNKIIKNGAYALIHKQDIVEDGEIAVVLVNGFNATLKKFSKQGDFVILEPMSNVTDDPDIKTQIYDKTTPIKILGKYVGKFEINK